MKFGFGLMALAYGGGAGVAAKLGHTGPLLVMGGAGLVCAIAWTWLEWYPPHAARLGPPGAV